MAILGRRGGIAQPRRGRGPTAGSMARVVEGGTPRAGARPEWREDKAVSLRRGCKDVLGQPRRGDRYLAHGVSRGTRADHLPSPVRGGRASWIGDPAPSSRASYAPDGACRGARGDPTAYAVGYESAARERAGRPYLHAIRGCHLPGLGHFSRTGNMRASARRQFPRRCSAPPAPTQVTVPGIAPSRAAWRRPTLA